MRRCPRSGCTGLLPAGLIVCPGDFAALASSCRGKRRKGEPAAAGVEGRGGGRAYPCGLCVSWHNGGLICGDAPALAAVNLATVAALRADPRVGWRGVLQLADAWAPEMSEREKWAEGLDQRVALSVAF